MSYRSFTALALFLLVSAAPAHAQETGSPASASRDSFHVELRSGQVLEGPVERETLLFKKSYLTLGDTARYELDEVLTFSTEEGYFRRVPGESLQFARRTYQSGRISRYAVAGRTVRMNAPYSTVGPSLPRSISVGGGDYFSKDGGELRPVEYGALENALADDPQSMAHLRTYRTLRLASWGGIAVGLGTAGVSVAGMSEGEGIPVNAFVGAGIAVLSSWVPMLLLDGQLDRAIEAYGR